jgi:hypothetical protein
MKKILIFTIAALFCAGAALADTAQTMPKGTGRVYVAPTFFFVPGTYDGLGSYNAYEDGKGRVTGGNLGFAVEYGILDWCTIAFRWAPGWNFASTVDLDNSVTASGITYTDRNEYNVNGVADIDLGVRFLIVGEKAPVKSEIIRVSFAPGVKIPLPGPDFESQYASYTSNIKEYFNKAAASVYTGQTPEDPASGIYTVGSLDRHAFGIGGRFNADYIFSENLYIGFFTEFTRYLTTIPAKKYGFEYGGSLDGSSVDFSSKLTFEMEPVYTRFFGSNMLTVGLPFTVNMAPPVVAKYEGRTMEILGDQMLFSMMPRIGYLFFAGPMPMEVELDYTLPIYGKNYAAQHALTLLLKVYFGLPPSGN